MEEMADGEEKKSYFSEWCQITGWHGILDIHVATNWIWKIFWLLVVFGGALLTSIQCFYMIKDYITEDQWVTSFIFEDPKDGYLPWPNMTICELAVPPLPDYEAIRIVDGLHAGGQDEKDQGEHRNLTDPVVNGRIWMGNGEHDPGTTDDPRHAKPLSKDCEKTMVQCGRTNGLLSSTPMPNGTCCETATEELLLDGRTCINLHSEKTFADTKKKNSDNRIYYILNPKNAGAGFKLLLFIGQTLDDDDFRPIFYVMPGTRNVISMIYEIYRIKEKQRLIDFGLLKPDCKNTEKFKFFSDKKYRKELCKVDCQIQWQMKFCGCFFNDTTNLPVKKSTQRCTTRKTADECEKKFYCTFFADHPEKDSQCQGITVTSDMAKSAVCYDQCPDACETGKIDADMSSSLFIDPTLTGRITKLFNINKTEISQLTMIEMYYQSKQHRVFEKQQRQTIDEFISNIGGNLGAWSGISFLSIVQILYYIVKCAIDKAAIRKANYVITQKPKPCHVGTVETANM